MDRRYLRLALQIAALVGVAMSGWLLVQYLLPPSLSACGAHGGCNSVRHCAFGSLGGESWPAVPLMGLIAFGALLGLSLSSSRFAQRVLPLVGLVAAASGIALIGTQIVVCKAICKYCVVADVAGIVAGAVAWMGRGGEVRVGAPARWVFSLVGAASVVASFVWGMKHSDHVRGETVQLPAVIESEQRAGIATVVEFADFECPYCRQQHLELAQVLPSYGPRVHFVRKHVPLSMHVHAETAARAACCAEEQGRGEVMADSLFRSPDLSSEGCEATAGRVGVDLASYRACVGATRVSERLQRDRSAASDADVRGLPTMFIGNERFDGVVPAATVRQSIDRALQHAAHPST